MASSSTHLDQPIPQRPLRSWFCSWVAVHDRTPLEAYLRYRLRVYQAKGRKSFYPLPFDIAIDQGRIVLTPNPEYIQYWERLRDDSGEEGVQFLTALEMHDIARDEEQLEAEDQEITHRLREVVEAIEKKEGEAAASLSMGVVRGKRTSARYAENCRRPRLPFPWIPVAGYLAIACMTMVEAFQLSLPFLDIMGGVDTSNLPAEWSRNFLGVLGGAGFALTATAGLFYLWHLLIRSAVAIATNWDTSGPAKSGLRLAGMLFLSVILLYGTVVIATLRHETAASSSGFQDATLGHSAASQTGTGVFVFLTLLVPAASAYLHYKIGQSAYWQRRDALQAQQARFARDEDERLLVGERLADAMDLLLEKRERIEEQQARLRVRRRALAERVLTAQREWLQKLDDARFAAETYAYSLLAALEGDNLQFLRFAYRCQALHLVPEEAACHPQAPREPRQSIRSLLSAGRNGHEA